jgi:predicted amidophosphoribosyltransferase
VSRLPPLPISPDEDAWCPSCGEDVCSLAGHCQRCGRRVVLNAATPQQVLPPLRSDALTNLLRATRAQLATPRTLRKPHKENDDAASDA